MRVSRNCGCCVISSAHSRGLPRWARCRGCSIRSSIRDRNGDARARRRQSNARAVTGGGPGAGARSAVAGGFRPLRHPLTRDGYVYRMVAQHEAQHGETILQTLQLKRGVPYHSPSRVGPPRGRGAAFTAGAMVRFPGGTVQIGTDDRRAAYDNERPATRRRLAAFDIDETPVTNGAYLEFMEAGGYRDRAWWSDAGRAWLRRVRGAGAEVLVPRRTSEWWTRTMDVERCRRSGASGRARVLLRSRGVRALGRQTTAHGGRVGSGGDMGSRGRRIAALPVGRCAGDAGARQYRSTDVRDGAGRCVPRTTCRRSAATA